jgi:hypothetical protein
VSRQRYLVRRAVAVVALVIVGYGGVRVLDSLVSKGSTDAAASTLPPTEAALGGAPVTPAPTAPPVTEAATTTAPPPEDTGPPSPDNQALVYIAGDSDAGTFGPYLEQLLDETGLTEVTLDYKVSSGLARPDFFDWPARFAEQVPVVDPDIVVVTFGGNDAQGLTDLGGDFVVAQPTGSGDEEWRAEYGRRVGEVMDYLMADGRTLIWVGIPNDDNPDVTARMQVQDETVKAAAAARPGVIFIDTWKRFSGLSGGWAEFVVDPRDNVGKDVRASDGFHLNENGAEILALDIARAITDDLRRRGAAI